MLIQEKKYKDYMSQEYEPVDESTMPYLVDIRAIKQYADSKGVGIAALSDEEKWISGTDPNFRELGFRVIHFWCHFFWLIGVF